MSARLFLIALLINRSSGWTTKLPPLQHFPSRSSSFNSHSTTPTTATTSTQLQSGVGIAKGYSWREEAFEIEVTVKVPPKTKAKDIGFKAKANSVELTMLLRKTENQTEKVILLDPERALRGRIVIDGTYWVISDSIEDEAKNSADDDDDSEGSSPLPGRKVTVTIEKQIKSAKDAFEIIDYDWNGVYREELEDEVSYRKYDEPEEMDVREYAQSLGVDIDNINMSMVDKSMFSSGLNLTKSTMDGLTEAGLMKEVTQQSDGSEWTTGKDGEQVPFNSILKDKEAADSDSSLQNLYGTNDEEGDDGEGDGEKEKNDAIPFLDTDSPWQQAPNPAAEGTSKEAKKNKALEEKKKQLEKKRVKEAIDPISTLTVARLREILRSRGLKVSGNKKELQDRLRAEVQSMVEIDTTE